MIVKYKVKQDVKIKDRGVYTSNRFVIVDKVKLENTILTYKKGEIVTEPTRTEVGIFLLNNHLIERCKNG